MVIKFRLPCALYLLKHVSRNLGVNDLIAGKRKTTVHGQG